MSNSFEKMFGEILREFRLKSGLSQEELANMSDLDRSFVSMLERGLRQPTITTLFRISEQLNVKPSDLIIALEKKYEDSKN